MPARSPFSKVDKYPFYSAGWNFSRFIFRQLTVIIQIAWYGGCPPQWSKPQLERTLRSLNQYAIKRLPVNWHLYRPVIVPVILSLHWAYNKVEVGFVASCLPWFDAPGRWSRTAACRLYFFQLKRDIGLGCSKFSKWDTITFHNQLCLAHFYVMLGRGAVLSIDDSSQKKGSG